jgi:ribosomal protein S8
MDLRIKKIKNRQIRSFVTTVTLKISINPIGVDIVDTE